MIDWRPHESKSSTREDLRIWEHFPLVVRAGADERHSNGWLHQEARTQIISPLSAFLLSVILELRGSSKARWKTTSSASMRLGCTERSAGFEEPEEGEKCPTASGTYMLW